MSKIKGISRFKSRLSEFFFPILGNWTASPACPLFPLQGDLGLNVAFRHIITVVMQILIPLPLPHWNITAQKTNKILHLSYEPHHEKTCLRGLRPVLTQTACTATEARYSLEKSDIETRGIIPSRQLTTKVLIRLHKCAGWSAPLLFAYDINRFFSWHRSYVVSCQISHSQLASHHKMKGQFHMSHLLLPYANSKGTDQPAHPRSLISTFVVRCLDSIIPLVSISRISSL